MRLWALLFLAASTADGLHQCQSPKQILEGDKPEFDFGENWSYQNCGVWDQIEAAPWRVAVGRTDGATCFGILLSNFTFITSQCKEVANDFRKDSTSVKAFTGLCYDQKAGIGDTSSACTSDANSRELDVKSVEELQGDGESHLHLWHLSAELKGYNPMCLFNQNQKHPGGYKDENYKIFDRKWKIKLAAQVGGAPTNTDATGELCVKTSGCLNAEADRQDFSGDFLVMEVKGRLMLRGFFYWPMAEGQFFTYTDVTPFIRQIVTKSYDLFLMPEVPKVIQPIEFSRSSGLNDLSVCGIKPTKRRRRDEPLPTPSPLINAQLAGEKQHPWHASVSHRHFGTIRWDLCGATLISNRAVVTAAHCLYWEENILSPNDVEITLGMHNTQISNGIVVRMVKRIEIHPKYQKENYAYDVAVLLFDKIDLQKNLQVRPICLWKDNYDLNHIANTDGVVVGWGKVNASDVRPNELQMVQLKVQSYKKCYLQEKQFFGKYLKPGVNFCAGVPEPDGDKMKPKVSGACLGDSGGGFSVKRNDNWFLRGVVSLGVSNKIEYNGNTISMCDVTFSSLYTDLTCCMQWIQQVVAV